MIIDSINELTPERKEELKAQFASISDKRLEDYKEKFEKYKNKTFTRPVIKFVGLLPKDELAALAESLVNLTSLKRRVSLEEKTVGGPIDVAIISKGDGFIWIKRKHYFSVERNPQFLANYYREADHDKD